MIRPVRRQIRAAMLTIVLISGLALTWQMMPAAASASIPNCDTPNSNYFDGYYHNLNNSAYNNDFFEGASAYIITRNAYTCNTDVSNPDPSTRGLGTNFTTSWVMIADHASRSWSQVGYIAGYNQFNYFWAQVVAQDDQLNRKVYFNRYTSSTVGSGTTAPGERHAYTEKVVRSCPQFYNQACIQSFIDSTLVTETNFDPFTYPYWRDGPSGPQWDPQYTGEKTYQANDIDGTTAAHTNFSSLGVQVYPTDNTELEPCTLASILTTSRATYKASSCQNFDIWTTG